MVTWVNPIPGIPGCGRAVSSKRVATQGPPAAHSAGTWTSSSQASHSGSSGARMHFEYTTSSPVVCVADMSVPQFRHDGEVIGAPHAVDRRVPGDVRGEHVARATELGLAHHDVVDPTIEIKARGCERIGVRPRVALVTVARGFPRVAQHDMRQRRRGAAGE